MVRGNKPEICLFQNGKAFARETRLLRSSPRANGIPWPPAVWRLIGTAVTNGRLDCRSGEDRYPQQVQWLHRLHLETLPQTSSLGAKFLIDSVAIRNRANSFPINETVRSNRQKSPWVNDEFTRILRTCLFTLNGVERLHSMLPCLRFLIDSWAIRNRRNPPRINYLIFSNRQSQRWPAIKIFHRLSFAWLETSASLNPTIRRGLPSRAYLRPALRRGSQGDDFGQAEHQRIGGEKIRPVPAAGRLVQPGHEGTQIREDHGFP